VSAPALSVEHILAEIARRETAQRALETYSLSTLGIVPAAHHRMIYAALEALILDDAYDDLLINTPPGSAKSTVVSHVLPAWYLGNFPGRNVIIASHTASLAEKWSRRVRDTVDSPDHNTIFPDSALSKDSTAVARWTTSTGGECLAAGVGMSILGFRSDLCVIDDPVSGWEQAQSITQLQKIHDWYRSDLKSRLKPQAKIVIVCQRLSANDLAGFVIKEHAKDPTRRLRVITLPMVCDSADDPLGRAIGERLWPEWYTEAMVADLRKDEFIWQTMWQQKPPSDDGSWVTAEDIQFRPSPVNPTTTYGMTDLALSVNTGDYTVHLVVAVAADGSWDIIHGERARVDPDASASTLVSLCATHKPLEWLIDDDNASKVFMPLVATRARQMGTNVPWKPLPMRGQDKETRAAPLRGQFKRRMVFMPPGMPWTAWLTTELLTFPNAVGQGVDDGVDTLSLMGRRMMAVARPTNVIPLRPSLTTADMTLDQLFEDMPNPSTARI
jgi:predicted phage terminase large subunit-like protein